MTAYIKQLLIDIRPNWITLEDVDNYLKEVDVNMSNREIAHDFLEFCNL